jgi:phosphoribosylformylglycinamidine synthase
MASKGGVGIELDMNAVPCREEGMTPYEMMLSESQERMLMVLKPGREAEAEAIFRKWELDFAVIGTVTDTGRMVLKWRGETVCDIPLEPLADEAPCYDRPWVRGEPPAPLANVPASADPLRDLVTLMGSPDLASRRWIYEQYDPKVGGNTVQPPGGDAAVVRVHGTDKALAITTDCVPRYCFADPVEGGRQAIAEAWRNLSAVGALPLAATDCMNFANPQRPEIMGQFVGCIEGMAEACTALDFPIVSGNVSLYNESKATGGGSAILPTPAIGGVGLLKDWRRTATIAFKNAGDDIWLVGAPGTHLGQSIWLREMHGLEEGPPPPVDLAAERRNGDCVRDLIERELVTAVHDISDGGLLVALTEMALASGLGATLDPRRWADVDLTAFFFGEDQARYVVTTDNSDPVLRALAAAGVPHIFLGSVGGDALRFGEAAVTLAELRRAHESFLPSLMNSPEAQAA